jgi:hypothetical protein
VQSFAIFYLGYIFLGMLFFLLIADCRTLIAIIKIVIRIAFAAAICNYIWLNFGVPPIGVIKTKKIPERP